MAERIAERTGPTGPAARRIGSRSLVRAHKGTSDGLGRRADGDQAAEHAGAGSEREPDVSAERVADPVDRPLDAEAVEQVDGGVGGARDVADPRERLAQAEPRRVDEDVLVDSMNPPGGWDFTLIPIVLHRWRSQRGGVQAERG